MTLDDRRAIERADLDAAIRDARRLVSDRLDDAAAHAERAVTQTLRDTPEGRATAARARRSPSCQAAINRLAELLDSLAAGVESMRVRTYKAAWRFYRDYYADTPEYLRPGDVPSRVNVERCRTLLLHDRTIRQWLKPATDRAADLLVPALTAAGNAGRTRREAADVLDQWRRTAEGLIQQAAQTALSDNQTLADTMAGRDVFRPEFLHPHPLIPE